MIQKLVRSLPFTLADSGVFPAPDLSGRGDLRRVRQRIPGPGRNLFFGAALSIAACQPAEPRVIIRIPYVTPLSDALELMSLRGNVGSEVASSDMPVYPIPADLDQQVYTLGVHLPADTNGRVVFGVAAQNRQKDCLLAAGDSSVLVNISNVEQAAELDLSLLPIDPADCGQGLRTPRLLSLSSVPLLIDAGDAVNVVGWGLRPDHMLNFNAVPATTMSWMSPRAVSAVVPWLPQFAGPVELSVAGAGEATDQRNDLFIYAHKFRFHAQSHPYRTDGSISAPLDYVVGDFDNANGRDVAVLWNNIQDSSSTVTLLLSDGQGGFRTPSYYRLPDAGASHLAALDVNGDGSRDLAVTAGANETHIAVLLNDGSGAFARSSTTYPVATNELSLVDQLVAVDVNNDSHADLALLYRGGTLVGGTTPQVLYLLNGVTGFSAARAVPLPLSPYAFAFADLDGQGAVDLAVTYESAPYVPQPGVDILIGTGGGAFAAPRSYPGPGGTAKSFTTFCMQTHTSNASITKTGIGYVRVSTQEQATEGVSLDAQRDRIRCYCKSNGIKLVDVIADEGISGSTMERPGLQTALRMLKRGRANTLIVAKLDRLSRSVRDICMLIDDYFADESYHLLSVCGMVNTHNAAGRMLLLNLANYNQFERDLRPVPLKWPNQGWGPSQRKEVNQQNLDNLSLVQVKFLSPRCKGEALPPSARLTIKRVKRG